MRPTHLSFIDQDLRQHSFRQQALQNIHFSGCDLRGCDFFQADLRGARFVRCRTGYSPQRLAIAVLPLAIAVVLMLHAISTLVFSTLGTLPSHAAWPYVVALYIALAIATVSIGLTTLPWPGARIAQVVSGLVIGTLMGFFYGGRLTDNNPAFAVAGAVGLGLLGGLVTKRVQRPLIDSLVGLLGAIAAYGLAGLLWVSGSNLVTTGAWGPGMLIGAVAVCCVVVSLRIVVYGWRSLKNHGTTSFRQADLRDCSFQATDIAPCDVTHANR
jgi:hypothetical protein